MCMRVEDEIDSVLKPITDAIYDNIKHMNKYTVISLSWRWL